MGRSRVPPGFICSLCVNIDASVDDTRFVQHSCTLCHGHARIYSQIISYDREIVIHWASSDWKDDGDHQRDMAGGVVCFSAVGSLTAATAMVACLAGGQTLLWSFSCHQKIWGD